MAYRTRIIMKNARGQEYEVKNFQSCTVNKSVTEMTSTFSFSVDSFDIEEVADVFTIGTEVNIWQGTDDGNMIHTICGWINQEPRKLEGLVRTIEFSGVDYSGRLQYRLVTEAFQETDIGEIVAKLMKKYAPEFTTEIQTTGMTITAKYDKLFLSDILKELAGIVDYDCFVDTDKTFKFIASGFAGDGRTQRVIKTNEFKKGSANFSKDASRLVNRLYVAGGNITSKEMTETYTYTADMNNFLAIKRKPEGVHRVPEQADFPTEYLFINTFQKDERGRYNVADIQQSTYYSTAKGLKAGVFKYPQRKNAEGEIEEITALTWEGTIDIFNLDYTNQGTVYSFFLEKIGSAGYLSSTGLGVYYLNRQFYFFITGEEEGRILMSVSADIMWNASSWSANIACRWYEKTMEIWVDGVLVASKELAKVPKFLTNYNAQTEIHLAPEGDYPFHVTKTRLSFIKRTEEEIYSFFHREQTVKKVYVFVNGRRLRVAVDNLQDDEGYDVMLNYNEQTFEFLPHLELKGGDVIEIKYAYEYTIMDVIENEASQRKYGLFEDKLVLASNNREYVKAQANKHVQKYSKPVLVGSLEPFDFTYEAGELVTITIPELYVNETDVKITAVSYSSSPNTLSCKLTLESEANVSQIFANIIKRVEFLEAEKFYNEDEELQQLEKFIETVEFTDKLTIEDLNVADFVFDKAKFNRAEFSGKALG